MSEDIVVVHGRFAPNGSVLELAERPETLSPQEWFNFLSVKASDAYKTLAGSRIVFRLSRERLNALQAQSVN